MSRTKYIVKAFGSGTKIELAVGGRNAQAALAKVQRNRVARHCDAFMVIDRVTNFVLATGTRRVTV